MGTGASARLADAANASPDDLEPALAWKNAVLDSIVIQGGYAIMGAAALGNKALESAVAYSERGDQKLACIVDTGRADLFYSKFNLLDDASCLQGKDVKTWVLLMPSVDSDPRCYGSSFTQSMLVTLAVCGERPDADIRFVHRDFYLANPIGFGSEWLPGFLDKDEKILPASKRDSMLAWFDSWVEMTWKRRAGVHWAIGQGFEEVQFHQEPQDVVRKLLKEGKAAADSEYGPPLIVVTVKVTVDGDSLQVSCTNAAGDEVCSKTFNTNDTIADLGAFLHAEFPDSESPTFWHDSDKVAVETHICDFTSLTATRPWVDNCLLDVVKFPQAQVKFALGDLHGLATEFGLPQLEFDEATAAKWGEANADIYFFADVAALSSETDKKIEALREAIPANILTLIIIAKDFESFKYSNFAHRLNAALGNTDICVFATLAEIESIKTMFIEKPPTYPNAFCFSLAMIEYPRLHFFTLLGEDSKTCGRDVPDGSLLGTSVKYSSDAPTLPPSKLAAHQFVAGPQGPLHFVTVPGDGKVTLIKPCHVLVDIFRLAVEGGCTEGSAMEKEDAINNVKDLIMDHKQFGEFPADENDEKEAPEPRRDKEPDGTFESAEVCLREISLRDVKEVKSLGRPPPMIIVPLKAVAALIGHPVGTENEWKDCQAMMANPEAFIEQILAVKPDAVTEEQWEKVRILASDADFTYDRQKRASRVSALMTAWVLALLGLAPKEGDGNSG